MTQRDRETILALADRFEHVWSSDRCPVELKKKIVRTVVEEIVVNLDEGTQTLAFVVHWKGGVHTQLEMQKPVGAAGQGTALEDLDIIRRMGTRYGDDEIAYVLNKLGRRTGKGKRWNQERVATARRNHAIPGQPRTTPDPNILTMGRAAEYLGVSGPTIRRLVGAGVLPKQQVVPWAPWEVRRTDLHAALVQTIASRLRRTGKLLLDGVISDSQLTLLQ